MQLCRLPLPSWPREPRERKRSKFNSYDSSMNVLFGGLETGATYIEKVTV